MIKTEVSYTISGNSRTFHYYDGWLGIIDARIDYLAYRNSDLFRDVKFKVMWDWNRKKVLDGSNKV